MHSVENGKASHQENPFSSQKSRMKYLSFLQGDDPKESGM